MANRRVSGRPVFGDSMAADVRQKLSGQMIEYFRRTRATSEAQLLRAETSLCALALLVALPEMRSRLSLEKRGWTPNFRRVFSLILVERNHDHIEASLDGALQVPAGELS